MEHKCSNDETVYYLEYNEYDAKWHFDAEGYLIPITYCPFCGIELPIGKPIQRPEPSCYHKRLELRGHVTPDDIPDNTLYLQDLSLVCLDCGAHVMSIPNDVTTIVNIPHSKPEHCDHPGNVRISHLGGFGSSTCLQCGKYIGPVSPSVKLHVEVENANI